VLDLRTISQAMTEKMTETLATTSREMITTDAQDELRLKVAAARARGERIGLVPTMGALHAGHMSLVVTARQECDFLVATIFVNPTQFGPSEDFGKYPRPLQADVETCRAAGVDLVYHPPTESMYPDGFATYVVVEGLSNVLEGEYRPGHFRGVATVVVKLLNCVQTDLVYFGRKDYQQQLLIRKVCRELDVPVEIRTCPTVREADGLALSSRNRYLTPAERTTALTLSQSLNLAKKKLIQGQTDVAAVQREMLDFLQSQPGLTLDYAVIAHSETLEVLLSPLPNMIALVAARVGDTRLIDNLPISL